MFDNAPLTRGRSCPRKLDSIEQVLRGKTSSNTSARRQPDKEAAIPCDAIFGSYKSGIQAAEM
jgi:hypothetical protein